MNSSKVKVFFWPDGDWCYAELIEEFNWKSDDYTVLYAPIEFSSDEIDALVQRNL